MWPFTLSGRLPIVALVGRYLTNQLIGRGPIGKRKNPLVHGTCVPRTTFGISTPFGMLSPSFRQVAHALLTRLPLGFHSKLFSPVRLACVKHAASVRPEPGSNSP